MLDQVLWEEVNGKDLAMLARNGQRWWGQGSLMVRAGEAELNTDS